MSEPQFRSIRISGSPKERGQMYGSLAQKEIQRSKAGYTVAFAKQRGWSWAEAVSKASVYEEPITAAFPEFIEEMQGIADGSGLTFLEILTLNCRTELLWPGVAEGVPFNNYGECTSIGLTPERTETGEVWVGQNWDWLVHGVESVVILEVEQDNRPNFVTIVEAGLLAKAGMNSAGVALVANALVSSADGGQLGIPFHVLLRAILDCESLSDVVSAVHSVTRASSANYLVGEASGAVLNFETAPGGIGNTSIHQPKLGALVHANHFLSPPHGITDLAPIGMSDSFIRQQRMASVVATDTRILTLTDIQQAMGDHAGYPNSVCCHPDPRDGDGEKWQTVMSVVFEARSRTMRLTCGTPCANPYVKYDLMGLLGTAPDFTIPPENPSVTKESKRS